MADYLASIFGTEKDKVNCSFYFKIGACRHGERCSRIHNKPTFSQTILLQNLYQNPQNVTQSLDPLGKETTIQRVNTMSEEDAQEHFDDFFEDVFVELEDKYGEIEEMNFRSEEDAERAVNELGNRWFGGRPIHAELSPVTDFREACCRQYEMGECTRSGFCNFMHLKPISRELRRELYGRRRAAALERRIASYIGGGADRSITANTTRRGGGMDLERSPFGRDDGYSRSSRDRDGRGDRGGGRGSDRGGGGETRRRESRDRDRDSRRRRGRSGSRDVPSTSSSSKRRRSRSRSKERSSSRSKKHAGSSSSGGSRSRGDRGDRGDRAIVNIIIEPTENVVANVDIVKIEPKDDVTEGAAGAGGNDHHNDHNDNSNNENSADDYGSYNPAPPPALKREEEEEEYAGYADHHPQQDSYANGGVAGGVAAAVEEDSSGYGGGGHDQQQQQQQEDPQASEDLEEHYLQQLHQQRQQHQQQQQQQRYPHPAETEESYRERFRGRFLQEEEDVFAEGAVKVEREEDGGNQLYNDDSNSNSNSNSNQMMANYGYAYAGGEDGDED
ncbi:Splicing factor U2AF 26 kDa subunit [Tyrophagus putrescentiae]|nr:Splicing factor U2AF 26 kDa subunit [Tyrophagus putrescentiae]